MAKILIARSGVTICVATLAALLCGTSLEVRADDPETGAGAAPEEALEASRDWLGGIPAAPTEDWQIGFGGRLYDKWWASLDAPAPEGTHPGYPEAGKQSGDATWRCKECHGWDYEGLEGAYGTGSHFSGIIGIDGMVGADPRLIRDILAGPTHGFTAEMIPDEAMERLALFVTRGQHDTDHYIDRASRKAIGDAARGERYYQNICAPCHGFDGTALNFSGDPDDPEFIGTVATENPWETLHKIRNGQPGQPMPALRVLPIQDLVDVLAYTQTLPAR